MGNINREKTQ